MLIPKMSELKKCDKIHYFGLGFIQIKMNARERYHFYSMNLKNHSMGWEEFHTHRYNFHSLVIKGQLVQDIVRIIDNCDGGYMLEQESCSVEEIPVEHKLPVSTCDVRELMLLSMVAGSSYNINRNVFHRVRFYEDTITKVTKIPDGYSTEKNVLSEIYHDKYAWVARKKLAQKECPFKAGENFTENQLWEIVEKML